MAKAKLSWWQWKITPFKGILLALFGAAAIVTIVRFFTSLGAVTGMNDSMPWALWKTVDVIVFIALGASGFTMAFVRYFTPGGEQYEMIMRRSVIWAAIAYLSAAARLVIDFGLPWRAFNPFIFGGNLHSPLFEVAWCMLLYLFVLFFENIPRVMEQSKSERVLKLEHGLHKILPIFVLCGVVLSSMHQSSLGTLFMITGRRMDVLWYHPWTNYVFLLTSIACGLAMAILIEGWSHRYYKTPFEQGLLQRFAPFIAGALAVVLAWRIGVLAMDGNLAQVFAPRYQSVLWWGEILIGYVLPILLYIGPARRTRRGLVLASAMTVAGVISLRVNTGMIGLFDALNTTYVPTVPEVLFTVGATAGCLVIYTWFAETLPGILGRKTADPALHAGD